MLVTVRSPTNDIPYGPPHGDFPSAPPTVHDTGRQLTPPPALRGALSPGAWLQCLGQSVTALAPPERSKDGRPVTVVADAVTVALAP